MAVDCRVGPVTVFGLGLKGRDFMNKFSKFCRDTLMTFYKNRMEECLDESMTANLNGDIERGSFMYMRYLSYKRKYERLADKK